MNIPDRHVRPNPDGGWDVEAANQQRTSHHLTGTQAIAWAKTTIRQQQGNGTIRIHGRHGEVRDESI